MGIVLALVLSAPVVGVQTDGTAPCDTDGFARDLKALRPELEIVSLPRALQAPIAAQPAEVWLARIEGIGSDQAVLRVTGNPTPLLRPLPGQDCRRAVKTAASIVDGLLDQLPSTDVGPLSSPGGLRPTISAWGGAGTLQGPVQFVASFALGGRVGLGAFEFLFVADLGLLASVPLATVNLGPAGSYRALPFDFELGGGWSPRLGPGRLSLDGSIGLALTRVWPHVSTGAMLFSTKPQVAQELFLAPSVGYTLELPARFFVGLRAEERWAPQQTTVTVDIAIAGDQVPTRTLTFTATGIFGWRFF
jgi:hypothetical protein